MAAKLVCFCYWNAGYLKVMQNSFVFTLRVMSSVLFHSKWRTTPVVGEVFAEVLALVVADGAVDAAEAVEEAAVPGEARPRTRK